MIETWLCLVVLFCPLPDTSTPEAAANSFGKEWLRLQHDDDYMKHDDLDPAKHLFSDEGWKFVERARKKSAGFDEEYATLKWSFQVQGVRQNADGTSSAVLVTTLRRNKGRDYKTKKVRVSEETIPHKIVMAQEAGAWKVTRLDIGCGICLAKGACNACKGQGQRACYSCKGGKSCKYCKGAGQNARGRTCWSCRGNGICRGCKGVGGQPCYSCKGKKKCKYCVGKSYKLQDWSKMWGGDPGTIGSPTEDRTTPTSAAQAFLNYRVTRWRTRSLRAQKRYAKLIELLAAGQKTKAEQAFASAKAVERMKEVRGQAVVEEVEVVGSTAFARIRTTYKKNTRLTRVTLSQRAGVWLIDNVQSDCFSCKGKKVCNTCKGVGYASLCRCKTGKCALCRGIGKRPGRGGVDQTCLGCKGAGKCFVCKGTGKMQCFGCRPTHRGKCYSCKGGGWVPAGSRGIF